MRFSCHYAALAALTSVVGVSAQDFMFRAYQGTTCNHNDSPGTMWPNGNGGPATGAVGACFTVEFGGFFEGVNSLEIDHNFVDTPAYVLTYCNDMCGGGQSDAQKSLYCYWPPDGCTIGSFEVVPCCD